ncbi:MAG: sugar ABC transporter permease [Spirochaetaceae bacterium]|nr:MAG: sugar ABC transporter permease [Spirochaetaceae bacterium]
MARRTDARSSATQRELLVTSLRKEPLLYLMLFPPLVYFAMFRYWPMYGVTYAFRNYSIFTGEAPWVGLAVFRRLVSLPGFWVAFRNNVIISFGGFVFGFPVPIILSLLINELVHIRFKKFVQTTVLLPSFISWVIIGGLVYTLLSPSSGVVAAILRGVGYEGRIPNLLVSTDHFRKVIIVSYVWRAGGFATIIYLAAIASIDYELYDAAVIDGAGRWAQAWRITLPSIRPVIIILLIFRVGALMDAGFEQIFAMYNPLVYEVSEILDTYVYKVGLIQRNYSLATAAGLFQSLIGLVLVVVTNWIAQKVEPGSGIV